jgi:hypothetical protein
MRKREPNELAIRFSLAYDVIMRTSAKFRMNSTRFIEEAKESGNGVAHPKWAVP